LAGGGVEAFLWLLKTDFAYFVLGYPFFGFPVFWAVFCLGRFDFCRVSPVR
jgi:hypothetical protein